MNQNIRKYIQLIESALTNVYQIEEDTVITLDDIKSQRVRGNAYGDRNIFDMVNKFVRSSENSWEDKSEALNYMQTVIMGVPLSQEQRELSAQQNVEDYLTQAVGESNEDVIEEPVNEITEETNESNGITVGELRKVLEGVPDDAVVALSSDGNGEYEAYIFDGPVLVYNEAVTDGLGVNTYIDDDDYKDAVEMNKIGDDYEKVVAVVFPGSGASRY